MGRQNTLKWIVILLGRRFNPNYKVTHVSTKQQVAHVFTKPLGHDQFLALIGKLGITNLYAAT